MLLLAPASKHTSVSVTPRSGDVNTTFSFAGEGWRPGLRVQASYFVASSESHARKTFGFIPRSNGRFLFELTRPIGLVESGVTSSMCFRQQKTRLCEDFYVAAPAAQFMPATGKPGGAFLLVASGFLAGRRLQATLTLPNATTRTFALSARTDDAFVSGGPFGSILVSRGGAAVRFATKSTDPPGAYTVLVRDSKAGSRARAVLVLEA